MRHDTRRSPATRLALALACCATLLSAQPAGAQARRAMTVDDLLALHRVSDPQLSPDGSRVLYTLATPDVSANRLVRHVWVAPVSGGAPKQLTTGGREGGARWSPDGTRIAFLATKDGSTHVHVMDAAGGPSRAVTSLSGDADQVTWSPDGRWIAFTSQVYPGCADDPCNRKREEASSASKVQARTYDRLLYRHWTEWSAGRRSHLFVVPAGGGMPRNLTPGADYDVPPVQREGSHPIAFSPDSREIAFVAVTDRVEAISTNGDIFTVPVDGSAAAPTRITTGPGFDGAPAYSPDGRWLAYRSQATPMYEADRWRLMRYDRQARTQAEVAPAFDRSVDAIAWSPDSAHLYVNAEDQGHMPIFRVAAAGGTPEALTPGRFDGEFTLGRDGRTLVVARSSQRAPAELVVLGADGRNARALTTHNATRLAALDLGTTEHFTFAGAGGASVHAMLLRPPAFDPSRRYPVAMILHGGPQTQFGDTWSFRWNTQLFAAQGWAVLMVNRRGSTGFGQAFTDEIRGDWGGKAFEDVMAGLDASLAKFPFLDGTRVAAAGGSYGGYMAAWLASQAKGRFKALVAHCAVYNLASMYGATEELWFPEFDLGGPPWAATAAYERWSPSTYAAEFGKYKTPMLVVHGELDFRVPYTQGLELFTAMQRQDVPSRLLIFPDEGHWVLKPQNSERWYAEVFGWIREHLGTGAPNTR